MGFYSVLRMTRDSDILLSLYGKDVDSFIKLLSEDFFIDDNMVRESLLSKMKFNIFDKKTLFKIDFILKTDEEYENLKFRRRTSLKINGIEVYVISIEDLIISKLNWARDSFSEIQLNDVRELLKNDVDKKYINEWITKMNMHEIYQRV